MEEVSLDEVADDNETMTLLDGRELSINPGDYSIAICWSPTATLEITKAEDGRFFDIIVRHKMTEQEIRARWK